MKKTLFSVFSLSFLTLALGCQEAPPATGNATDEPTTYVLRGGVTLALKPGTSLDEDELTSRNQYGGTLLDTSGTAWFARVEAAQEESLLALGLERSSVAGRDVIFGATTDENGGECHVLTALGDGRFLALSRIDEQNDCPTSTESVIGWLPDAEVAAKLPPGIGEAQEALSFGSYVGSFDGIDAYSNGSIAYDSGSYSCCGLKWQCVEYVNRYYYQKLGHANLKGTGNAKDYFATASSKGLIAYANTNATPPAVGDMLVSTGGTYGHIAIVREVGPGYVKVIHQNWTNDTADNAKTLSMSSSNGLYTVGGFSGSYPVKGWLRRPGVTGSASVSSVTPPNAWLKNQTTFLVHGKNLPSTLTFWVAECGNLTKNYVTSTEASFTCTPSYTTGFKAGVVKTQSSGTVLMNFTVSVQ